MYLYYYSCIVKHALYFVLTNVPVLVFVNFLMCPWTVDQSSVSVLGRQHICKQHGEEGDSKCWVRAAYVFLVEQMRFLRGCNEQSVTWWKWKNLLQEIKCFAATCFVQGLQFCLGTVQCCFSTSFLICCVTCEKEVHRWSSSFGAK